MPQIPEENQGVPQSEGAEAEGTEGAKSASQRARSVQSDHIEAGDPVEAALAEALRKATLAGAWDAVAALTGELRARREARAGVVSLEAARTRRGRQ